MRKKILSIAAISLISIAEASYELKVPLESSGGGSLPNGSIIFKDRETTIPPIGGTVKCYFESATTFWGAGTTSNADLFFTFFNGDNMTHQTGYDVRSITYEGVTYTRGKEMAVYGDYTHYEICREE
jgi:hypothetical protein